MKASLQLDFELPDDQEEYKTYVKAYDYRFALDDICNLIRQEYKYNSNLSEEVFNYLEWFRDEVYGILSSREIND